MNVPEAVCQISPAVKWLWLDLGYSSVRYCIDKKVSVPQHLITEWAWCLDPTNTWKRDMLFSPLPIEDLMRNASRTEWGTSLSHLQLQGSWYLDDMMLPMKVLELRVIRLAYVAFLSIL